MSDAERLVWSKLRHDHLGVRFRRQHPIGPFIADFACLSCRVVVEIDGSQHIESRYDTLRDSFMEANGWVVLRFWASDVVGNLEGVIAGISDCLDSRCPPVERGDRPT
jgi:very-short-patch-repair endonuclease